MNRYLRRSAFFAMTLNLALVTSASSSATQSLQLRFDPRFILEEVARHLNVRLDPAMPLPAIFLESTTPLGQFQDAIEAQWGFRPRAFTNAYVIEHNEIYLTDNARYYVPHDRTLDDSLAHELAHYLQRSYFEGDPGSDWCEFEAIRVQERFRAAFPPPASHALIRR
jgi:hypothetical protein